MSALPSVEIGHMDLATGRYVRDGEVGAAYLTVAGVRVRASVHRLDKGAELSLVVDPYWTDDNRVTELDVIEIRAHGSQAAMRVKGALRNE